MNHRHRSCLKFTKPRESSSCEGSTPDIGLINHLSSDGLGGEIECFEATIRVMKQTVRDLQSTEEHASIETSLVPSNYIQSQQQFFSTCWCCNHMKNSCPDAMSLPNPTLMSTYHMNGLRNDLLAQRETVNRRTSPEHRKKIPKTTSPSSTHLPSFHGGLKLLQPLISRIANLRIGMMIQRLKGLQQRRPRPLPLHFLCK